MLDASGRDWSCPPASAPLDSHLRTARIWVRWWVQPAVQVRRPLRFLLSLVSLLASRLMGREVGTVMPSIRATAGIISLIMVGPRPSSCAIPLSAAMTGFSVMSLLLLGRTRWCSRNRKSVATRVSMKIMCAELKPGQAHRREFSATEDTDGRASGADIVSERSADRVLPRKHCRHARLGRVAVAICCWWRLPRQETGRPDRLNVLSGSCPVPGKPGSHQIRR